VVSLTRLTDELLGQIELAELPSLKWGFVDGSLSEDQIASLVSKVAGDDETKGELLENLIKSGLVIELSHSTGYRYRSRFAEGIRLVRNLRQWFPNKSWVGAPSLVSDYRVDARPRKYPRRDLEIAQIENVLDETGMASDFRSDLIKAMLGQGENARKLSKFQLDSLLAILGNDEISRGVIISAGTGSGKTMAFYLPALLEIAELVESDSYWVKAVALYPRVELLKDQFSEAFRLIRTTDALMKAAGKRPIILGSFFGSTPSKADRSAVITSGWIKAGSGYECPYLSCPLCGKSMIWSEADLDRQIQRLNCIDQERCNGSATDDQISLVRDGRGDSPPDILFTTSESLNARISDMSRRHNFGISRTPYKRARFILLDEIHTYSGTSGAHAALLIRRWRWAINRSVRIVGLSATLDSPAEFFQQLTGLNKQNIQHVEPDEIDLESDSMEYQVILRADPASRTSLLSTSIQTTFLMARLLDQMPSTNVANSVSKTEGRLGSKMFVFTDDLDTINRLYDDLRDAEGTGYQWNGDGAKQPLAALRADSEPDAEQRGRSGQNWRSLERFGRTLSVPLRVSRTSSQDTGVDGGADVIVATASLEVGFDDPTVGAVLQHKAPYGLAAFAQRKGRAGRPLTMRPWMITVLSDYGRDRLAFQSYDKYFDIVVPPLTLPVNNRYLLRMQMVFAFMDWLASSDVSGNKFGWWWQALDGPASFATIEKLQSLLGEVLEDLLSSGRKYQASLRRYMKGALGLTGDDELDTLLWDAPRSLLLEVLPTLDRRLKTKWSAHPALHPGIVEDVKSPNGPPNPLPDYVPSALFHDLDLPEVAVLIPPPPWQSEPIIETMPVVQSLRTFAPGRVSRRFGAGRSGLEHWVPVPKEAGAHNFDVDSFVERSELIGSVLVNNANNQFTELSCYRPWSIRTQQVEKREVGTSSNSFLRWQSNLDPTGKSVIIQGPVTSRWNNVISSIEFHLNRLRSPILSRRFATGSDATLNVGRAELDVGLDFSKDGSPTTLGFEQEVDGFIVHLQLPEIADISERSETSSNTKAWRVAYFNHLIQHDSELQSTTNTFQRDWLAQVYLSALIEIAVRGGHTLQQAHEQLISSDLRTSLERVTVAIFQADEDFGPDDHEDSDGTQRHFADSQSSAKRENLRDALLDLAEDSLVRTRLASCAEQIWSPDQTTWLEWLRARLHETFGEASIEAAIRIAPLHTTPDSLLVDLDDGLPHTDSNDDRNSSVWITESTLGGTGAVEAISQQVADDQARFMEALEAAVAPSDLELVANDLDRFLDLLVQDESVKNIVAGYRSTVGLNNSEAARSRLHSALAAKGLALSRSLSIAINYRILREGANAATDQLIHEIVRLWSQTEDRIGLSIDLRVFCYLAVVHSKLAPRVNALISEITGHTPNDADSVGVLAGILWQRPAEVRRHTFDSYNPFRKGGYTDPSLIRDLVGFGDVEEVDITLDGWHEKYLDALRNTGFVSLICQHSNQELLHSELIKLIAQPVDVDYLQFYPVVHKIERSDDHESATLILREKV
jgi:hypothetical protein